MLSFPQQMSRIDRIEDAFKREIAIFRQNAVNRPLIVIDANTRLCNNCNRSIVNETNVL